MKRIETLSALWLIMAVCLLAPSRAMAAYSADTCQGCHFTPYGSAKEVCVSCHQGGLHYHHVYQDPGGGGFPRCGSPPDRCKCCHGDPPDYETPPVVAETCSGCHSVTGSDIVAEHNCSPYYHPAPGAHCLDCHGLGGIPHSRIAGEEDANNNCNDVLDNDADCATDNEDSGCTVTAQDEICDDGRDNDFDSLIDGEDPDCCGDGVATPPEECDDGNSIDCDGCSEACEQEYCGDGKQCLALGEECEDGNGASCDGCSGACLEEYCGDGVICPALGEECDGAMGCRSGYTCDHLCTCREESTLPCGASTAGMKPAGGGVALNLCMLTVPFALLLLRRVSRRHRERSAARGGMETPRP
jgi:cysteine-rich repeat protein